MITRSLATIGVFYLGVLVSTAATSAAVLNLDFGPTSIGTATTISPYHAINGAINTTWNTSLGTADPGALVYGDGTAATGINVNLGITSGTSSVLATQPSSSSALGSALSSGIYGGTTSSARDGVFNNTTGLSIQVTGLAAGTYNIYYVGRNTNRATGDNYTQVLSAGQSAASGNFNFSSYASDTITYGSAASNANTTTWVQGQNFAQLTMNLTSGNALNLAFTGTGAETRGFLNSLQIEIIPEPATLALIGAAVLTIVARPRRRTSAGR